MVPAERRFHCTEETKKDISIVKFSISNLYKAIVPRTKCKETLKNQSSILLIEKRSLRNLFDSTIV